MITATDSRRRRPRAGLTLIELMLALSLSGLLFLGARLLLDQAGDAGRVFARHADGADVAANGDRLLRALVGGVEVGADTARPFVGDPEEASFESWCQRPAGWLERCRVTLSLDWSGGAGVTVLVATLSTGERYSLRTFRGRRVFRYFGPGPTGRLDWIVPWGRSLRAPLAVAVVTEGDTVVLRVGERG